MRFYTITYVSNFLERPLIRTFHSDMFHGLGERDGKEWPKDPHIWASTEVYSPLQISRTIRGIPQICRPSTHLVISARLAAKLTGFQNIRLSPIEFKRLVDVDWQKGDQSWFEKWGGGDPMNLLRTLPEVPEFHRNVGQFFEVHTWRLSDILDRYPTAKEITIEKRTPPLEETEVIRLSAQMLTDFPMLWSGSIIVNREVFDILDADLDRDFFIVRKYDVD